jgi:phage tail-like protein
MAVPSFEGTGTFRFTFALDKGAPMSIKSIDGLSIKVDKVETRVNAPDGSPVHKVFAGNKVYLGQINATRVLTMDTTWAKWFKEAVEERLPTARCEGSVFVYNAEHKDPVLKYTFEKALPIEYKITGLNAATPNPIEETITFMYETLKIDDLLTI